MDNIAKSSVIGGQTNNDNGFFIADNLETPDDVKK